MMNARARLHWTAAATVLVVLIGSVSCGGETPSSSRTAQTSSTIPPDDRASSSEEAPIRTTLVGAVVLNEGAKEVRVRDRGGGEAACESMLEVTLRALPILEEEIGFPFPRGEVVIIDVFSDLRVTHNYAGRNDGDRILIQGDARDAELVHELAHYWIDARFVADFYESGRWLTEGLADWFTYRAFARDSALGDPVWLHREKLASFARTEIESLSSWQPPRNIKPNDNNEVLAFYAKAYLFVFLLASRFQDGELAELHAAIAAAGRPIRGTQYLERLAELDSSLEGARYGWLVGGMRREATALWQLEDTDRDGLPNCAEIGAGTNPRVSDTDGDGLFDGHERLLYGTDPLDAKDPARASSNVQRYSDGRGDVENGAPDGYDLSQVSIGSDAQLLSVTFEMHDASPRTHENCRWCVGLDGDADGVFDRVLGIDAQCEARMTVVGSRGEWDDELICPLAIVTREGDSISVAFPLPWVGLSGEVNAFAFTAVRQADRNWAFADQTSWIELDLRTGSR